MEIKVSSDFKGKTALVTGASKGIGKEIAITLLKKGCKVIFISRSLKNLKKVFLELDEFRNMCFPIVGDVSYLKDVENIYKKYKSIFNTIDYLVCNVGHSESKAPGSENYEEWQRMFHLNFFCTTNIIEKFKDDLALSKGSIVCISSICGQEIIPGAPITYSVAKSALNAYVKGIAVPFGKKNIRINAIAPGNILFEKSIWDYKLKSNKASVLKMLRDNVPLKKFGNPKDIAYLTSWLLSKEASFVTGSIFVCDGGQTRN